MTNVGKPSPDEVHLWYVEYADVGDEQPPRYVALLDDEEKSRQTRFHFERDQRSYAVSHALLRTTLSHYANVAPADWRFVAGPHGRPEIAAPAEFADLRFNLSHTRGAALVGIVRKYDIGVDLETIERKNDGDALAERYFSPREVRDLRALSDEQRRAAFFEYWTLKEAYVKGRGLGLHLPLDQFSFRFDGQQVAVTFEPGLSDEPRAWRFVKWRPGPTFQAAVAVRCGGVDKLRFLARRVVPLVETGPVSTIAES